jgi:putative PEP-CTERM system TPR-repeat lipoprotein
MDNCSCAGQFLQFRLLLLLCLTLVSVISAADDTQGYLQRAKGLYAQGDLGGAVIELKTALQKNPSLTEARLLLGETYLALGDGKSAEKELMRALALRTNGADGRVKLAEAYILQQRFDDALAQLDPPIQEPAELAGQALNLRGVAQMGLGRLDQARESFELALQRDPDADRPVLGLAQIDIANGDVGAASERIDGLLRRDAQNANALLFMAELEKEAGRLESALSLYSRLLEVSPTDQRALLGRTVVYLALNQLDQAQADLQRADEIRPDLVMTVYLRGLLAFRRGDLNAARENLIQILGVAPEHVPSQLLFGVVSYLKEDLDRAEESLSRVHSALPENFQVAKLLGASRIKLKTPERAIDVMQPFLTRHQDDVQLLALLASAYMMHGDHAKGAEMMQRAVELEPEKARLRTQLALSLLAGGEADGAVDQLQSAVELEQDLIQVDVMLVMMHLKQQRFEEALKVSKALETRMPNSPIPYNLTGLAYFAQQDDSKAAEAFNKALAVDSTFVTAELNLARIDIRNKDLNAAEQRYQHILQNQTGNVNALIGLAGVAEQREDAVAMQQWLEQAWETNPDAAQPGLYLAKLHLGNKEPLKALAVANELSMRFKDSPAVLEVLGTAQLVSGETNNATRTFQRLTELRPSPNNFFRLGQVRMEAEDLAGARLSLAEALRLNPGFLEAKQALTVLELRAGNANEALVLTWELQRTHPEGAEAYALEGAAYTSLGQTVNAIAAYEQAYKRQKSAQLMRRLVNLYETANRPEDAIALLQTWLSGQPNDAATRLMLAMFLQKLDRRREAIREFEILRQRDASNAMVLNNLAWLYFQENDSRALETAEKAYALDTQRAEVVDTYGWILLQKGDDPQRALTLLQQALVTYPTSAEIGYHLAVALHRLGRDEKAAKALRRILNENPTFPDADAARALLQKVGG